MLNIVEGKSFKNQEVFMDFTIWRKCNFLDCKLVVQYGILQIEKNDFIRCTWIFPKGTPAGMVYEIIEMIKRQ